MRAHGAVRTAALLTIGLTSASPYVPAQESGQAKKDLSITYIANEGMLIQSGHQSVLIDALFREGVKGYARVEKDTLEALEHARPPFDTVKLVLVTHMHKDHFDAQSVASHLRYNPAALLVTSAQVADQVRAVVTDQAILDRVQGITLEAGEAKAMTVGGVGIELIKLSHGTGRFSAIDNLGYIINIGNQRILHIGDAEINSASLGPLREHVKDIHVACVPDWWLLSNGGREYLGEMLRPRNVIAMHIRPDNAENVKHAIQAQFPDAIALTKPGQRRKF